MASEPEDQTKQLKAVEFYAAGVNGWINTALERDKSLLTLSAAGLGLLVSLMATVGVKSTASLMLYGVAALAFLVCLVSVLMVLGANKMVIERALSQQSQPPIAWLDKTAMSSFAVGALLSAIIGFSTAINSYLAGEKAMATHERTNQSTEDWGRKSFDRFERLQQDQGKDNGNGAPAPPPPVEADKPEPQPAK